MDKCESCRDVVPFTALSRAVERAMNHSKPFENFDLERNSQQQQQQRTLHRSNSLMRRAFQLHESDDIFHHQQPHSSSTRNVISPMLTETILTENNNINRNDFDDNNDNLLSFFSNISNENNNAYIVQTASTPYYYRRKPNCLATALTSGIRGAVVGSVFGGAMGLSTAAQSGYRGTAMLTYAGQGALRNAAAFSSWTAVYGFTRCGLVHARKRDDIVNAACSGFFTGGLLTLISARGYWRYNQSQILSNAAGSAMIAMMFDALNQM